MITMEKMIKINEEHSLVEKSNEVDTHKSSHPKYRPDIDGLRAIAVLSVVFFHAFPNVFPGGFIGVDVFFVISGFLISSILYKGLDNGSFSFFDFYSRRIRRIFPSLITVLLFCILIGWVVLLPDEYMQLGKHIVGGSAFVSNFMLLGEAGYFDETAINKPLLHLWSLAIEEQFYIVWPLILFALWKIKINIGKVTVIALIISFLLNLFFIYKSQPLTFYSPQTRFWEILSGGLLAWVTINKKHLILKLNSSEKILSLKINTHKSIFTKITDNTYSIIGIVLLFIGFVFINESVKFPGFYAAIPVVGAILLILAGPNAWFNKMVLSNRIIVWFGLISFPLYLWHWPLLSFAHIMESGTPSVAIRLSLVVLSIFMAWVSLHFIENKIRKGSFFKVKTIFLLVVMACLGACGYVVTSSNGFPSRVQSLSEYDSAVLSQMETPRELSNDSCRKVFPKISDYICITKSAGIPETILFGDSHALHFYHGLSVIDNKNVGVLGGGWTSAGLNPIINSINKDNKLNVIQKDIYDYIGSNPAIKNVVISCASIVCHKNKINFDANLRKTFDYFLSKKKNITFILDIPKMPFDSKKCLNERPFNFRADASESCLTAKSYFDNSNKKYRDDVFKVLKDYPEVRYFDPSKYICDENYCYAFIDNKFLYMTTGDNSHLSNNGSELLANPLYKKINSIN